MTIYETLKKAIICPVIGIGLMSLIGCSDCGKEEEPVPYQTATSSLGETVKRYSSDTPHKSRTGELLGPRITVDKNDGSKVTFYCKNDGCGVNDGLDYVGLREKDGSYNLFTKTDKGWDKIKITFNDYLALLESESLRKYDERRSDKERKREQKLEKIIGNPKPTEEKN
jgi:hypothetical protein